MLSLGPVLPLGCHYTFIKIAAVTKGCGHIFSPSTGEAEAGRPLNFKASLVHRASSRTTRATQRNPALAKKTNNNNNNPTLLGVWYTPSISPFTRQGRGRQV